ncbi:hypothetical protein [Nocardia sp. CNY236]|uniref:hypothetical protein n=1 Tax=Nocardia sp. CNY236 TaxID=1169152 RepID=UPI0004237609|nr:hypothetical protein [Nocardia sp. CNY236]
MTDHGTSHSVDAKSARFSSGSVRTRQVKKDLESIFRARADKDAREPLAIDDETRKVLDAVVSPLRCNPPEASQAAEAALTIAQFSLTEGRVLNVVDNLGGDLTETGRLHGDRAVSDHLCKKILQPRQIPATQGPLQSSSFRSGYQSRQVRSAALKDFVEWQSQKGRTLDQVRTFVIGVVDTMLDQALKMPPWVEIAASRLTFANFLRLRERLLAQGSAGAFEQYLLAGLMEAELAQSTSGCRVDTKNVGANDTATNTPGDIVIRERQAARIAFEVTAATWESKVGQLDAAARQGLSEATIVARGVAGGPSAEQIAAEIEPVAMRLGIDPAVVDLYAYIDILASRVSPHARAEALTFVYRCLVRWHSREPNLAQRLIDVLQGLNLVAGRYVASSASAEDAEIGASILRVRHQLSEDGLKDHPGIPTALRCLADDLERGTGS